MVHPHQIRHGAAAPDPASSAARSTRTFPAAAGADEHDPEDRLFQKRVENFTREVNLAEVTMSNIPEYID
jgi:hypothetical protein